MLSSKIPKRRWEQIKQKPKLLVMIAFFSAILIIVATYAWLSASLNVKIKFFDLVVASDSGLFISLDGVNFGSEIEITLDTVIRDLNKTYPHHTNQWAGAGLWPVSTIGIKDANQDRFNVFKGEIVKYRHYQERKKYLATFLIGEPEANTINQYIAFDLFLKNISGSPKNDNLFLLEDTFVELDEKISDDDKKAMSGIVDSMRFGFIKIGSVATTEPVSVIQNIKCNNNCQMVIFEPNGTSHSAVAIEKAAELGVIIKDGEYVPTYAVIKEGERLEHPNGHIGSGFPLDSEHFALQETIKETDLIKPIFEIPHGITKMRIYVWLEGQDIDSLETTSRGAALGIGINLEKDLAGYE